MTEPPPSPEQLTRDAEARMAAIEQAGREVAELTAVARTPNGSASVTVGVGGSVRSIALTAEALRGSPAQLGGDLVAAIHTAAADVARQSVELLVERTGIDISDGVPDVPVLPGDPQRSTVIDDDPEADEDWWRRPT